MHQRLLKEWADLIVHRHGFSITFTKAPPTTAGGASSHWGAWAVSAWSFRAHTYGSSGQPSAKRRRVEKHMSSLVRGGRGILICPLKWHYLPDLSLACVHALVLPARLSVPTRAVVWHARHRRSGSHVTFMHGNGSSVFPVSAVRVVEFSPGRMGRLGSADRFEILWVALEARIVSVRSRPAFLFFWLAVKPVTSK